MKVELYVLIIACVGAAVLAGIICWFLAIGFRKKFVEAKIGSAESMARDIKNEALKAAETMKKEATLEIKEEKLKAQNELEKEAKEQRAELHRYEQRVLSKEEAIDKKATALEKKESKLSLKEAEMDKLKAEMEEFHQKQLQELEKISGLTSEQAKEYLIKSVEEDVKHETAIMIKEMENRAKEEADKKAKEYVVTAIQKCAADHVAESTISVVPLPNDEMKGRIIGREGRNIRTLETLTGVELIIDDTPEAVVLSGSIRFGERLQELRLKSSLLTAVFIRLESRRW